MVRLPTLTWVIPTALACNSEPNTLECPDDTRASNGICIADDSPHSGTETGSGSNPGTNTEPDPGNGPDEALDDITRLAFIGDGVPTVTDTDGHPQIEVRPPNNDWYNMVYLYMNRKGTSLGFSASIDNVNIRPYGVKLVTTAASLTATEINGSVSRSKGPIPDESGEVWGWIQYGGDTRPSNSIRMSYLDGEAAPGDNVSGYSQVWGYGFLQDGRFVTIYSSNSTDGPLWALDPDTETSEEVSSSVFYDHIEISLDNRVLGAIYNGFAIFDANTGTTEEYGIFPWGEDQDLCPVSGPQGNDPFCYYEMLQPDWSPSGTKVAFVGRSNMVTYDDREGDVFVFDIESGEVTRITDDDVRDWSARFSGDGQWIYWIRQFGELVRAPADGSGDIEVIWAGDNISGMLQVAWPDREPVRSSRP